MQNKVLSKEEYQRWLEKDRRTPLYIESKPAENERGWIPDKEKAFPFECYYGDFFRAWIYMPTDEERKEVKW